MRPADRRVLHRAANCLVDGALDRLDLPHVVYVYDRLLGEHSVIGPFGDPVAACRYAERFRSEVLLPDADQDLLQIVVVPLDAAPAVHGRQEHRRR